MAVRYSHTRALKATFTKLVLALAQGATRLAED